MIPFIQTLEMTKILEVEISGCQGLRNRQERGGCHYKRRGPCDGRTDISTVERDTQTYTQNKISNNQICTDIHKNEYM